MWNGEVCAPTTVRGPPEFCWTGSFGLAYAAVDGLKADVTETWWFDRDGDGWVKLTGKWTSNLTSYIRNWESKTEENKKRPQHKAQPAKQKPFSQMTEEEVIKASQ